MKGILRQNDTIWLAAATLLGYFIRNDSVRHVSVLSRFTCIDADHQNNVWAGGMDGLYSQRDGFKFNWGDRFPKLKSRIISIRNSGTGKLWVVTPGEGLYLVRTHQGKIVELEEVNKKLKKPIRNIQSLFVGKDGTLWLATNRGVYGLSPSLETVHYDAHDGLADDDVNAVLVQDDTLWVATVSGLSRMILRQAADRSRMPTYITRLRYQSQGQPLELYLLDSLSSRREIRLPSDASALEMDLASLDYLARGNIHFQVVQTNLLLPFYWWTLDNLLARILAGFNNPSDTTWVESGTLNLGLHLAPGRYRISARAFKSKGGQSQLPAEWVLLKRPYWYETIWLYLAVWCALGYGIWRIYRARAAYREINAAASMLQLQALQSQMNPHFIGNAVNAIQQFLHPPDPEKTSEYIALFMRLLRRTMHFSEKTFIPFEEELSYDREYLQLVQLRFEDRFVYKITGAETMPPDTPVPSMLLQPVLENATLHGIAPDGLSQLHLEFSIADDRFQCVLTDNGIGFKETQRQKHLAGMERISRGLNMLYKKIDTLNRLYDLDLSLEVVDLSDQGPGWHGTRVTLVYFPHKIWKVIKKQPNLAQTPVVSAP